MLADMLNRGLQYRRTFGWRVDSSDNSNHDNGIMMLGNNPEKVMKDLNVFICNLLYIGGYL